MARAALGTEASDDASREAARLEAFWRGQPAAIEACYRRYFATVKRAVGAVLAGADRETVVHEVFAKLIGSEELRRSFAGGAFDAWIATVARNMALNHSRRLGREVALDLESTDAGAPWQEAGQFGQRQLRPPRRLEQRPPDARLSLRRDFVRT